VGGGRKRIQNFRKFRPKPKEAQIFGKSEEKAEKNKQRGQK